MRKAFSLLAAPCLVLSASAALSAEAPMGPPKVIQIYREEVKPGKTALHEKVEAQWPRIFSKAGWPTHYLGMVSMAGPTEAWFITGFDSFAAWGKDSANYEKAAALKSELDPVSEKDGELLSGVRSIVAFYREDLSNHPGVDIAKMRYFQVTLFRVRPGHDKDFADAAKIVRDAYEKAKVERPWAVFQVSAGMPGPTYMVWSPMKSLEEMDAVVGKAKSIQEAEGEDGQKALAKAAGDGVVFSESLILAFNPKMSYPSKEMAARDPEFWTPKPAAKPAAREEKTKEAPADKK